MLGLSVESTTWMISYPKKSVGCCRTLPMSLRRITKALMTSVEL